MGTPLVVQWLRLCASMQGAWVDPWSGNYDPTCQVARKKKKVNVNVFRIFFNKVNSVWLF